MELELREGDYVADGVGGLRRVRGREALFVNRKAALEAAEPIQEQEDTAQ